MSATIHMGCGVCDGTNSITCINKNTFVMCNIPNAAAITCPEGHICKYGGFLDDDIVADQACFKIPTSIPFDYDCKQRCLGVCEPGKVHACTGINTYKICGDESDQPNEHITCPSGYVCTINAPCKLQSPGTAPLCSSTTTINPTTTLAPTLTPSPSALCQHANGIPGKYPLNPRDEFCSR